MTVHFGKMVRCKLEINMAMNSRSDSFVTLLMGTGRGSGHTRWNLCQAIGIATYGFVSPLLKSLHSTVFLIGLSVVQPLFVCLVERSNHSIKRWMNWNNVILSPSAQPCAHLLMQGCTHIHSSTQKSVYTCVNSKAAINEYIAIIFRYVVTCTAQL